MYYLCAINVVHPTKLLFFMPPQHILQVSELTKKVRFMLESELNRVWLCGEISNFISASSGHWYLSLKDNKSQVRCAMFKGNNQRVRLQPRNGQQILIRAKVSLYEPRGDFQLIIEQMEDAGEGLLRQKYEQLKEKLNAEGLFNQQHKKIIPTHIQRVGVITSATGAAIKDILAGFKRRNPNIEIIIYPSLVQGAQAAQAITHAINIANYRQECDVLIVGRGGGSLEDLWCFNEETVVRAIYHSHLPVVSAVGHEVDTTLADYVADLRVATPTAAAELLSQNSRELLVNLITLTNRATDAVKRKVVIEHNKASHLQHRLSRVEPVQQLQYQQQKSDELTQRLLKTMQRNMQYFNAKPLQLKQSLLHLSPQKTLQYQHEKLTQHTQKLINLTLTAQQRRKEKFKYIIEQLQIISPLATIARGYNIARNNEGNIIKSTAQVELSEEIELQVTDGFIKTKVIAKHPC